MTAPATDLDEMEFAGGERPDLYDPTLGDDGTEGPLSAEEQLASVSGAVRDLIEEAIHFVDEMSEERALADAYWNGEAPDEAEEDRSNIVAQVVREKHDRMMPQLLKILCAGEQVILFEPREASDVPAAEQQSEVVQFVVYRQNEGYLNMNAAIHDATLKGIGVIESWYERDEHRDSVDMTGLTMADLEALNSDPGIEISNLEAETAPGPSDEEPVADAAAPSPEVPPATYSARVTRIQQRGRVVIEAVPPEQFLYTDDAVSPTKAPILGRRRAVPAWRLIREGWDEELVMRFASPNDDMTISTNPEAVQRDSDAWAGATRTSSRPESYEVLVTEAYIVLDCGDGNGAVLRKFTCFGDAHDLVGQEPVPFAPFSVGSAYLTPHKMVGSGLFHLLRDLQQAQTEIERGILDSLAQAIDNDMVVLENGARMEDLQSTQRGRILREKVAGAIREIVHQFVGASALPVLDYYEKKGDLRAGTPPQSAGLESDALQSSTKVGVEAAVEGGQLQMERVARNLAETLFKQLFTNVRNLLRIHQDTEMIVRLRNQYVPVDPRVWDSEFDATVNTAFGAGLDTERINMLSEISKDQYQWIQALGPVNPVTSLPKAQHTKKVMLSMRGIKDFENYYTELPMDWQPPPPPPGSDQPPPSPEMVLAQAQIEIEKQKAAVDIAKKEADIVLQREKMERDSQLAYEQMIREDDRLRDKQAADIALKTRELELKHQLDIREAELNAQIERERATTQAGPTE